MEYPIRFTESFSRVEKIEADNLKEALEIAARMHDEEEIEIDCCKDYAGCIIEPVRDYDIIKAFLDYFYEDVLPLYLDDIARDPVKGLCDALGDAANHDLGKSKWLDVISREATRQLKDGENH